MKACMMYDHRATTGWCIVQEYRETDTDLEPITAYWVMFNDLDFEPHNWYPHGKLGTYQKALKRLELIENETIEPW